MFSNMRPAAPHFLRYAILFLAFSVFGLGLQAKLALYHSDSPTGVSTAKVSTENRSSQVLRALEEHVDVNDHDVSWTKFRVLISAPDLRPMLNASVEQETILLGAPTRPDQGGMYALHGPPSSSLT